MAEDERKAELIAELARSRAHISQNAGELRHDLDVATHLRRSFARHPAVWIGAAAVVGLIITRPFGRKKNAAPSRSSRKDPEPEIEKVGRAGLFLAGLKFAFDIARPVLIPWATRRFAEYFAEGKTSGYPPR